MFCVGKAFNGRLAPIPHLAYNPRMKKYLPPSVSANEVIASIGLISDTHAPQRLMALPTAVSKIFAGVDLVLHAGDVGKLWVLDELGQIAPTIAVHGNDETKEASRDLPYQQMINLAGRRILLWHNHYPDRIDELAARKGDNIYDKMNRNIERGKRANADFVIFGHWHIPLTYQKDSIVTINPGALASGGFAVRQAIQTVALLYLLENGRFHISHVNVDQPDQIYTPQNNFDAGFVAILQQYTASILSPKLTAVRSQLAQLFFSPAAGELLQIWRPLAFRCWNGTQEIITPQDLFITINEAENLSTTRKQELSDSLLNILQ